MITLLALAAEFKRDVAGGMKFFDQSIIRPEEQEVEPPQP